MSYIMNPLTAESLAKTENHWKNLIGDDDIFAIEYADMFTWANSHIDYDNRSLSSYAYGIFKKATEEEHAYAIVDIIQRPHGKKMTKLLKLDVSPCLLDDTSITILNELVQVMLSAILGTVKISGKNASSQIKIYGRSHSMFGVLKELHKVLTEKKGLANDFECKIIGRWLEISLKDGN